MKDAYNKAQTAIVYLKSAIYELLEDAPADGLKNVEIGKTLGIHAGHVGHEGHIPRTLLGIMEAEGVIEQNEGNKKWRIKAQT